MSNYLIMTRSGNGQIPDSSKRIFLGEWCIDYNEDNSTQSSLIANYHWDDRKKLYRDYNYILKKYEKILTCLTKDLNDIHNVSNSKDYWRVIIGPWLLIFLAVVYDRWQVLETVLNDYTVTDVLLLDEENYRKEILTMEHFLLLMKDDNWNLGLFSNILRYRKDFNINFHSTEM